MPAKTPFRCDECERLIAAYTDAAGDRALELERLDDYDAHRDHDHHKGRPPSRARRTTD